MAAVFALPITSSSQTSFAIASERATKRKRTRPISDSEYDHAPDGPSYLDEYTAVLSPNERAQRRLAGYSLIKDLPPPPFPHKGARNLKDAHHQTVHVDGKDPISLRLQHLSAMSAVLHKSLLDKDYVRARRALGLILRTDVNGKPVDIRAASNWAVGAEILFRQHEASHESGRRSDRHRHLREGFLHAKSLYEMLIIQYPHHRSWPDSVNAVDFYLAMFSLWIYVAQHEVCNDTAEVDELEVKRCQLDDAHDILTRMDSCMLSAPYDSNPDLFRLRTMVAEWHTLLTEDLQGLTPPSDNPVSPRQPAGHQDGIVSNVQGLSLGDDESHAP